jgi:hypothetical protein
MPAPDSTIEEVRSSVLRYIRMYEEGQLTLGDLSAELAVMAPAYQHAIGALDDEFSTLLDATWRYSRQAEQSGATSQHEVERALTEFRRAAASW